MFCIEIVAKRRECLRLLLLVGCGQMCPENEIVQIKSTFFHIFIHKNQFLSIVLLLSKHKLFLKSANYFRKKNSIIDVRLGSKHNSTLGYRTRISGMRFEVLVWQTCVGYKCIAFLDPPSLLLKNCILTKWTWEKQALILPESFLYCIVYLSCFTYISLLPSMFQFSLTVVMAGHHTF